MSVSVKVGCDPEIFARSRKTGQFVSVHDLIPGSKAFPHKVPQGAIQVDGTAAEFNIDPALDSYSFSSNISTVLVELQKAVGKDYELVCIPTVEYPWDYFQKLPPNVRELGCDPDFNAWTGQVNERPVRAGNLISTCTGAGHIHLGWCENEDPNDSDHFDECCIVAKQLDYYLGMESLKWDKDSKRRGLYGCAGAFRPKSYGIEYRTLSNVWVRSTKLQNWIYGAAVKAVNDLVSGNRVEDRLGKLARKFINGSESWWTKDDAAKSKDHKKIFENLKGLTGLGEPPELPQEEVIKAEVPKKSNKIIDAVATIGNSVIATYEDGRKEAMSISEYHLRMKKQAAGEVF